MTEEQAKIMEAYLLEVGDSILTEDTEDISPYGNYPVLRSDEPRLKADRTAYEGVVPKYANAKLPAVEYYSGKW